MTTKDIAASAPRIILMEMLSPQVTEEAKQGKASRHAAADALMATNSESNSPLILTKDQHEKRAHQFLAFCIIVTAILFILINAVAYFAGLSEASPGGTEASETARSGKMMPVLP